MNIDNESMSLIQMELRDALRGIWSRQLLWVRAYIVSTACDFADIPFITRRIMQNYQEYSDRLIKYYGYEKAEKLKLLLTEYFNSFEKFLGDMQNGRPLFNSRLEWYKSADAIIDFLTGINPHWSKDEWQRMLYEYLPLFENEALYRLTFNFAGDSGNFREIENIARNMADYMTSGIIRQFDI